MADFEKLKEEGMDFLKLMLIPISADQYITHKNTVDLYIRDFKEQYGESVDRWGWEMKTIFPDTSIVSGMSIDLLRKFDSGLLTITQGEPDSVLQVFHPSIISFKLDRLPEGVDGFLKDVIKDPILLHKLSSSCIDDESKVIIGSMINPEFWLSNVFPNQEFYSADENACNVLIDYAERLKDDKNNMLKLFTISNCVLSGLHAEKIDEIEQLIEESVDESNNYDDVIAMEKINKYFQNQKRI